MNFNLVEMYNGLLRFNKHILNGLAEGLKHLPNLDGVSKGDSLIINEQGNPAWGSAAFIPTFENAAYGIEWTKEVMMDKIQIKLFVCFCLAVALLAILRLALVTFILLGVGRILMLRLASLPQLSLIK